MYRIFKISVWASKVPEVQTTDHALATGLSVDRIDHSPIGPVFRELGRWKGAVVWGAG
jgi:hypothetical protein